MEYPNRIKPQEIPVFDFLCGLDQGVPIYEPCKPGPDFLLNGILAVETTILEQGIEFNSNKVLINEKYESIRDYLLSIFSKIDDSYNGHTYFVHLHYSAEVMNINKRLKREILEKLNRFVLTPNNSTTLNISENITIEISETNPINGRVLLLGGTDCIEQTGCSNTYISDIIRCLDEKNEKAKPWFELFPLRWLILLDNIMYGLDEKSIITIRSKIRDLGLFHKLIIIDQQKNPLLII